MNRDHLRSLLKVEFRRNRRSVLIGLGIAAAAVPVLSAVGRADPSTLSWVLFFATCVGAVGVVGNVLRDTLSGQLEFLTTLPVRSSTLAGASFLANALAALPVLAAVAAVVHWTVVPKLGFDVRFWWTLGASVATWLLASAFASLVAGMLVRFDVNKLGFWPVVGMVVLFVGDDYIDGWIRPRASTVLDFATANPDLAWVLGVAAFLLLFGAILGVGFFVACQGYERYRPKLDLIEW